MIQRTVALTVASVAVVLVVLEFVVPYVTPLSEILQYFGLPPLVVV